ncbi:MAG: alpha/beta hydrolase [Gemmataceae bacterium]
MKRMVLASSLLVCLLAAKPAVAADKPLVLDVWPGKPADDNAGGIGSEKFIELKVGGKPRKVAGKPTKWLTNVTRPTLTVYRPAKDRNSGAAMLICPGGGYHNLGWDVEGVEVAEWLNTLGITGIILKYRVPRRPGDIKNEPPAGPLKDAQRAVSLVRSKAKEWEIDPKRIGMIGFSAGGHLTLATCTRFDKRTYKPLDAIDDISCRPDFGILAYSGYLKHKDKDEPAPGIRIPDKTPPLFFVHCGDDSISPVDHSVVMYLAVKRAGVPAVLHVYDSGGHGFGVRKSDAPCDAWMRTCADWLRHQGVLKARSTK